MRPLLGPKARRRAFSILEAVVSLAILAAAGASLISLASVETKGVALTEDRFLAGQLLDELQTAFGRRPVYFYAAFPSAPPAGAELAGPEFPGLAASLVEEHPGFTGRAPGFGPEPSAAEVELLGWMGRRQVVRGIYRRPLPAPSGGGVQVIYRVQYLDSQGHHRSLEASEVATP